MNLYIIGNGFDIEHNLPTEYFYFREYLTTVYPRADAYDDIIPEMIIDNHGEERFDMNDIARYVIRIIDACSGRKWSNLEYYLGNAVFDIFLDSLEYVDMDAPDKETMRAIYYNQEVSNNIRIAFPQIKDLFYDWITDSLGEIDYNGVMKDNISRVISDGDAFLSFNYTLTLEKVYGILNVCHIHGKTGDPKEDIFFGHGDNEEYPESAKSFGANFEFDDLKKELRKKTQVAFDKHKYFFNSLTGVDTVHSFGFSFADVDMFYVEKIAEIAPGAIWYLNNRNAKNKRIREKLEKLNFVVQVDERW